MQRNWWNVTRFSIENKLIAGSKFVIISPIIDHRNAWPRQTSYFVENDETKRFLFQIQILWREWPKSIAAKKRLKNERHHVILSYK